MADDNRHERIVNAEPWTAPPGYTKRRCDRCRFWFSTPIDAQTASCPDCLIEEKRRRHGGPLRVVAKAKGRETRP